jgi:cell wall-associated NlpC family hydrolase
MKPICGIAILLLAACASTPHAVEPIPPAPRVIEHRPITPGMIESAYEQPRHPKPGPTAQRTDDNASEPPRDLKRSRAAQRRKNDASERSRKLVSHARSQVGVRYRYGGSSPQHGFDCSGLVRYVYRQAGIVLPRTTEAMSETGLALRKSELEPGDLVFFDTRRKPFSHVGIYIGQQRFIHAPASGGAVQLVDMRERYWRARYVGARRVVF